MIVIIKGSSSSSGTVPWRPHHARSSFTTTIHPRNIYRHRHSVCNILDRPSIVAILSRDQSRVVDSALHLDVHPPMHPLPLFAAHLYWSWCCIEIDTRLSHRRIPLSRRVGLRVVFYGTLARNGFCCMLSAPMLM
jgi:hypothetical protein